MSGPARASARPPRAVAAAAGAATAIPLGPLTSPRRRTAPRRSRQAAPALVPRVARALAAVPEHRLLDRLVRGRFWIGFVAFALLGIVGLQLSLLKLNTGIGRAIEHQGLLERQNATLRAEVSSLSAGDRVETQAIRMGMVVAPPGAIRFLTAGGHATALRAARLMTAPTATGAGATADTATGATATTGTASTTTAATGPAGTSGATTGSATAAAGTATSTSATGTGAAGGTGTGSGTTAPTTTTGASTGTAAGTGTATSTGTASTTSPAATGTSAAAPGTTSTGTTAGTPGG